MKWILIIALLAVGGFFAWKKFGPPQQPPASTSTNTTAGANQQNRIEGLAGAAPTAE